MITYAVVKPEFPGGCLSSVVVAAAELKFLYLGVTAVRLLSLCLETDGDFSKLIQTHSRKNVNSHKTLAIKYFRVNTSAELAAEEGMFKKA